MNCPSVCDIEMLELECLERAECLGDAAMLAFVRFRAELIQPLWLRAKTALGPSRLTVPKETPQDATGFEQALRIIVEEAKASTVHDRSFAVPQAYEQTMRAIAAHYRAFCANLGEMAA